MFHKIRNRITCMVAGVMLLCVAIPATAQNKLRIQLNVDGNVQVEQVLEKKKPADAADEKKPAAPVPPKPLTAKELQKRRMEAQLDRYRDAFEVKLKSLTSDMGRSLNLNEGQINQLSQAGKKFVDKKLVLENNRVPSHVTRLIYSQDLAALAKTMSADPEWAKVMGQVVSKAQLKEYAKMSADRAKRSAAANDRYMVAWMDRFMLLSGSQRKAFEQSLAKHPTRVQSYYYMSRNINDAYNRYRNKPVTFVDGIQKKMWDWLVIEPRSGNRGKTSQERARFAINRRFRGGQLFLDTRLVELERVCQLDEMQKRRLQLAAKGAYEIHFEQKNSGSTMVPPLTIADTGIFHAAQSSTLREDQKKKYEASLALRHAYANEALQDLVLRLLETKMLLSDAQSKQAKALVDKATASIDAKAWDGREVARGIAKIDSKVFANMLMPDQARVWATFSTQMQRQVGINVIRHGGFAPGVQIIEQQIPNVIIRPR